MVNTSPPPHSFDSSQMRTSKWPLALLKVYRITWRHFTVLHSHENPFTLYWCKFCSVAEDVTDQLHLHYSAAEVVPDSLTLYHVPVQELLRILVGTESVPIRGAKSATEQCKR